MFSDKDKCNYLQILTDLNKLHANIFTQKELSSLLGVSVRKISDFKNGNLFDFELLTQYAGIIGKHIRFYLN